MWHSCLSSRRRRTVAPGKINVGDAFDGVVGVWSGGVCSCFRFGFEFVDMFLEFFELFHEVNVTLVCVGEAFVESFLNVQFSSELIWFACRNCCCSP